MTAPTDSEHALFDTLLDSYLAGEPFSVEEQAALDHLVSTYPTCQQELSALQALSELDVPATPESNRIADRALESFRDEANNVPSIARRKLFSRTRVGVTAAIASAAAVALTIMIPRHQSVLPGPASEVLATAGLPTVNNAPQDDSEHGGQARVEWVYASGATRLFRRGTASPASGNSAHGQLLAEGDVLESDAGAACFVLDPAINVCIDGHSQLKLAKISGRERLFELTQGRVALQLDHQPRGFSVSVRSNGFVSTAIGTSFSVAKHETGVHTTVLEGRVEVTDVRDAGSDLNSSESTDATIKARFVDAHQRLSVGTSPPQEVTLTRAQEAVEWATIKPVRLWETHTAAILQVEGHVSGTEVWLDQQRLGVTPLTSLIPAGRHYLSVGTHAGNRVQEEFVVRPGEKRVFRKALDTIDPTTAPSSALPRPKNDSLQGRRLRTKRFRRAEAHAGFVPTAGALLSEAHRLMVEKRFDQAAQTYEALRQAHPNTPEARTVLIALARLELRRGAPTRAASLAARYLNGGGGALKQEARHLKILSLRAQDRPADELRAIATFLSHHSGSVHEAALRNRQATLSSELAQ